MSESSHLKLPLWVEILGWYGAGAILGAYLTVSFEVISASSFPFQFLNITGASALLFVSWRRRMMQTVFLNSIWIIIGAIAMAEIVF